MALLAAFGASHWLSMKRFIWSVPRDIQPLFQGPQHHIRHISSSVISVPAEDGRPASTFIAKLKPHEILPDVISLSLRVQNIYSPHIAIFSARFRQACRETEVTETRFAVASFSLPPTNPNALIEPVVPQLLTAQEDWPIDICIRLYRVSVPLAISFATLKGPLRQAIEECYGEWEPRMGRLGFERVMQIMPVPPIRNFMRRLIIVRQDPKPLASQLANFAASEDSNEAAAIAPMPIGPIPMPIVHIPLAESIILTPEYDRDWHFQVGLNIIEMNSCLMREYVLHPSKLQAPSGNQHEVEEKQSEVVIPCTGKAALEIVVEFLHTQTIDKLAMLKQLEKDDSIPWEVLGIVSMFDLSLILKRIIEVQLIAGFCRRERVYLSSEQYIDDLGAARLFEMNDLVSFLTPIVCIMVSAEGDTDGVLEELTTQNSAETVTKILEYASANPSLCTPQETTRDSRYWINL